MPFKLNLHHPTNTLRTKLVSMATRTRKANATLFDDRINVLDRNAIETSPTKRIFRTVSAILALVRVSVLVLHLLVAHYSWFNQDKMIDDGDSVELSEYCFNVCEGLWTVVGGNNTDDFNESVRVALGDLEKYVG